MGTVVVGEREGVEWVCEKTISSIQRVILFKEGIREDSLMTQDLNLWI